ncbi:MAG: hypothetical protein HOQ05_01750 [Corynebacteriales bacterium]|nr:hypothetical protein [Mycobacteriales bacterium]
MRLGRSQVRQAFQRFRHIPLPNRRQEGANPSYQSIRDRSARASIRGKVLPLPGEDTKINMFRCRRGLWMSWRAHTAVVERNVGNGCSVRFQTGRIATLV